MCSNPCRYVFKPVPLCVQTRAAMCSNPCRYVFKPVTRYVFKPVLSCVQTRHHPQTRTP
jgi:hypothetical protein